MSSLPTSSSNSDAAGQLADLLEWVMDVPCTVDFVLGTTTVRVRDCLDFGPDTVVRLKQSAGADMEIRVGGISIASGEVVILEENVGLRVNHILPPAGREGA